MHVFNTACTTHEQQQHADPTGLSSEGDSIEGLAHAHNKKQGFSTQHCACSLQCVWHCQHPQPQQRIKHMCQHQKIGAYIIIIIIIIMKRTEMYKRTIKHTRIYSCWVCCRNHATHAQIHGCVYAHKQPPYRFGKQCDKTYATVDGTTDCNVCDDQQQPGQECNMNDYTEVWCVFPLKTVTRGPQRKNMQYHHTGELQRIVFI